MSAKERATNTERRHKSKYNPKQSCQYPDPRRLPPPSSVSVAYPNHYRSQTRPSLYSKSRSSPLRHHRPLPYYLVRPPPFPGSPPPATSPTSPGLGRGAGTASSCSPAPTTRGSSRSTSSQRYNDHSCCWGAGRVPQSTPGVTPCSLNHFLQEFPRTWRRG